MGEIEGEPFMAFYNGVNYWNYGWKPHSNDKKADDWEVK